MDLLGEVLLDVHALGLRHLKHRLSFTVQDLYFLLAEVEFFARFCDILFKFLQISVERSVILGASARETSVPRHDLLARGAHQ